MSDENVPWHPDLATASMAEDFAGASESTGAALQDYLAVNYRKLQCKLAHHLGSKDFASECLHETWLRLEHRMTTPPAVRSLEAYLYRMACNIAIDHLRSVRTRAYLAETGMELESIADSADGPEQVMESRSALAAIDRAMQKMPRRNREVLIALRIEEKSRKEVAAYHGLSLRTVDNALRIALDHCAGPLSLQAGAAA